MDWASMVQVGLVVRPHGLRGQVVIAPDTDFGDERFAVGAQVWRQSGASLMALTVAHSHSQGELAGVLCACSGPGNLSHSIYMA